MQRLAGIERDKTMADKLMYIPNDVTQNYPFCRLQLVIDMFGHLTINEIKILIKIQLKSPRLLSQRIRKRYYKTLVTSVIYSPIFPSSLFHSTVFVKIFIFRYFLSNSFRLKTFYQEGKEQWTVYYPSPKSL